jgi:cytochrome b561
MNDTPAATPAADSYDSRTIALHWASALLVLALWIVGQTIDWFPKGTPRLGARSMHITLGVVLGLLLVWRLAWRRSGGTRLPPADPGTAGRLAVGAHHLLYALLALTVLVGLAAVWVRGDNWFNLFTVPAFDPTNKALRHDVVEWHGWAANVLFVLAGLHAAAALWHHRVLKDGALRRMLPQR